MTDNIMAEIEAQEMAYAGMIHAYLEANPDVKAAFLSSCDCLDQRDGSESSAPIDSYGSYVVALREFILHDTRSSASPFGFAVQRVRNYYRFGQWIRHPSEVQS